MLSFLCNFINHKWKWIFNTSVKDGYNVGAHQCTYCKEMSVGGIDGWRRTGLLKEKK